MADTEVAPTPDPAPVPASRVRRALAWRPPLAWRERTDWVPLDRPLGQVLRGARWGAITVFLVILGLAWHRDGVPFDRTGFLLWMAAGLACACIGRHPVWLLWVVVDFAPLAAVLLVYDRLRGLSDQIGLPTWWHPQIEIDKALFFGHEPTVWLQQHLKRPTVQWYDVVVTLCYFSFFFLPYILAGVMWLRGRRDFYRWSGRFVGLSFLGFLFFMIIPAAPPWFAARCSAAEVAKHPNNPSCINHSPALSNGGLLGTYKGGHAGTNPFVDSGLVDRGFSKLHLTIAAQLYDEGKGSVDRVAAVPSLHVGGTVLFVLFMWSRVNRYWKIVLAVYPFLMMFSLAYGAEHYVADGIAGALCAWFVHWLAGRIERRRERARGPDTLEAPPKDLQESSCPSVPAPATMPSST